MTSPAPRNVTNNDRVRMAYLVSHPIQYQAPLLRRIAREPDIDLTVFFGSDFSVKGYKDEGFGGVGVKWDVPLLEGYRHEFLPVIRDNARVTPTTPMNYGIARRLMGDQDRPAFDVLWVHGYASVNALHGITAANALGIPVLIRAESWLGDRERSGMKLAAKRLFFRTLSQMIDGVMPIGSLNAEYWRYYLGEDFPLYLMPYAVDNEYFQSRSLEAAPRREELRRELNLEPGRPIILFASKLQSRKRADDLLEAYKRLAPAPGLEPHPYLVIVGDGDQRQSLERQAEQSGLGSIRFCGFRNQSELPRFFDLATVFVLPSRHEPWGLIVNEVMNAGRAVIVSDEVGSQRDLITDGVEGAVFPAGDVEALADALRRTLATPETAAEMGRRGLDRISRWSYEEDIRGLRSALAAVTKKISA
ncbi:glycosyltransferase family 4 protein [Edaphobacter modestus]|uniref:Glycosyltransferase involved in cell wall biosynthesis n=1 Tax=Edaphobacter modestus TaxID=388466 RepID=A0A4Q7YQE8_9BACT|nr:glycosyltransferase family 4 protein [Edaphobacter modestus]RZU39668.1 glycosyltransferase involved in cell wall biosynthesis [Edaphobacter modestus]